MKTKSTVGRPARNPERPIICAIGVGLSEADRELVRELVRLTGARSTSEAVRAAIGARVSRQSSKPASSCPHVDTRACGHIHDKLTYAIGGEEPGGKRK